MFPIRQPLKSYASEYRGDVPLKPIATTRLPAELDVEIPGDEAAYVIEPVPTALRVPGKRHGKQKVPPLPMSRISLQEKRDDELVALPSSRRPSLLLKESSRRLQASGQELPLSARTSSGAMPRDLLTTWAGMKTDRPQGTGSEQSPSHRNLYANAAFWSPMDRSTRSRMTAPGSFLLNPRREHLNVSAAPRDKTILISPPLQNKKGELDGGDQEETSPGTYRRVSHVVTPRTTVKIARQSSSDEEDRRLPTAVRGSDEAKLPNATGKKKEERDRSTRNLQFETDQAFAPYDERMQAARQVHEARRKAMVVGPQAEWILMPGETPPDDRRNFNQVGMLPPVWLVEEAVRQVKRVFRWCFESPADAFTFFDIGGHYKLSITWLQRGFYRMNMHELWRCPHQDCCRFVCPLADDHEMHSYILMDERMCLSMMRMAHAVDNVLWKHDFVKFFDFGKDPSQAHLPTCVDVLATSAQTPRMAALLHQKAETGNRAAKASVTRQRIIDKGRDWGIREDWRRYARWLGGGNAWRLLHTQCVQLLGQREKRKAVFHQLCEDIRMLTMGDRKRNGKQVAKGEKKLERCVQAVKKTEMRILGTLEKYSLHLLVPKAIKEAHGRQVLAVAPDLGNLLEVMLDLVEALMSLTEQERSTLLLQKENPEGDVDGLSVGAGETSLSTTLHESSEEESELVTFCREGSSAEQDVEPVLERHASVDEKQEGVEEQTLILPFFDAGGTVDVL